MFSRTETQFMQIKSPRLHPFTLKIISQHSLFVLSSLFKMSGHNHHQNSKTKPTDLSNIAQGDDSSHELNTSLHNIVPSDFQVPGGGDHSSSFMDSHNHGDHDLQGKFNPFGGLPQPGDPSFTRQLGPIMGGKRVDEETEKEEHAIQGIRAPHLGEKRDDEPEGASFGLDPSQRKMKMD